MHDVCYFLTMTIADSPLAQRQDLKSEKISIGMQAKHLRAPVTLALCYLIQQRSVEAK